MKALVIILSILNIQYSISKDLTYSIDGKEYLFKSIEKVMASVQCFKGENVIEDNCTAIKKLNLLTSKDKSKYLPSGGADPGSYLCDKTKGELKVGIAKDESEMLFCQYEDSSFIDVSSLYYRVYFSKK